MTQELSSCPFCGSSDIKVFAYGKYLNDEPDAYCQCQECTTTGPNGKDEAGAAEAWNNRATVKQFLPVETGNQVGQLISVKDRLPKEGDQVLTYDPIRVFSAFEVNHYWRHEDAFSEERGYGVTHWMPLPPAPSKPEGE